MRQQLHEEAFSLKVDVEKSVADVTFDRNYEVDEEFKLVERATRRLPMQGSKVSIIYSV